MEDKTKKYELGTNYSNSMKNQKGMDEIDLWAESVGQSEKGLNSMRPQKRHVMCRI